MKNLLDVAPFPNPFHNNSDSIGTWGWVFIGIGIAAVVALSIFFIVRIIRKNKKTEK